MRSFGCLNALPLIVLAIVFYDEQLPADDEQTPLVFQVAGRVVDESGQPVAGAEVESLREPERSTVTNDAGQFTLKLSRKPLDVLLLRAKEAAAGRQAFATYLVTENARHIIERFLPPIEPGLPEEIKLIAKPPRKVEVAATDSQKQPVADAAVLIQATWYDTLGEAKTDAEGKTTLLIPADAPLASIVAMKAGVGLDYFLYQNLLAETPDRHRLARDHAGPVAFVLNGTRRITINVVDDVGRPLAGVPVFPWYIQKPNKGNDRRPNGNLFDGGTLHVSSIEAFHVTSNTQGQAFFDFLPADGEGMSFQASAADRWRLDLAHVDAGSNDAETTLTLFRTLRIDGQVHFADGQPAAGTAISVRQEALDDGRDTGPRGNHGYVTFADEQGRFRLAVFPDHFLMLVASSKQWAAPLTTCVVLDEPPQQPLQIELEKATRVHGRLTAGPDHRLAPRQQVSVLRRVGDEYRGLSDRGLALKPEVRRGRVAPASGAQVLYHAPAQTNGDGEFEVFLGPGKYLLRYGNDTAINIELNGEAEHEVNLHAQQPDHVDFAGRVVFEGSEQRGVPGARLTAYYLSKTRWYGQTEAASNSKGVFRFARRPVDMLLYARDEEGLYAQIASVAADDQAAIISLGKAVSAHGRLIDAATGHPVRNARVAYGIFWDGATNNQECGGSAQTDEQGEFTARGLVPGRKYKFTLYSNRPIDRLATIEPPGSDRIELGDYRVNLSGNATKSANGPVAPPDAPSIFKSDTDGKSRLIAAQARAKAEKKRVLLVFGADWSLWCHRLNDLFHDNEEIAAVLRDKFVVVLVDDAASGPEGRDEYIAKRFGHSDARLPWLVVLDGDGIQLNSTVSQNLEDDTRYNTDKVLALLGKRKPSSNGARPREALREFRPRQASAPNDQ